MSIDSPACRINAFDTRLDDAAEPQRVAKRRPRSGLAITSDRVPRRPTRPVSITRRCVANRIVVDVVRHEHRQDVQRGAACRPHRANDAVCFDRRPQTARRAAAPGGSRAQCPGAPRAARHRAVRADVDSPRRRDAVATTKPAARALRSRCGRCNRAVQTFWAAVRWEGAWS